MSEKLQNLFRIIFGQKINNIRIVPVTTKITITFTLIILVSNLSSNYINLIFNRTELVSIQQKLLAQDLKELNNYTNMQHEIYKINKDKDASLNSIEKKGLSELERSKSITLGVRPDGSLLFQASKVPRALVLEDQKTLKKIIEKKESTGVHQGLIPLKFNNDEYLAAYVYNENWDIFIIRGEEVDEFYENQRKIFQKVSFFIMIITLASAVVGVYLLHSLLRLIGVLTTNIMRMVQTKNLEIIDLKGAVNDDVSFLGFAFNTLSSTINNLVSIFRKFANQDIVLKAYRDKEVKLEGVQKELTIMFSDIKSFTFITETLGTDIIKLLNLHYDNAIREIIEHDGVIGAIIGDALLAVFGAMDEYESAGLNKSYQSVVASYRIQALAKELRDSMTEKRNELLKKKKKLSKDEEKVYKAVLLEVGVGLDGGEVFYGTIGSYVRMTNTVIGDNVNAASRLEGLTRVYKLPVICSEYVKKDIENNIDGIPIYFMEIDTVQVKGKTTGKKIYWPILEEHYTAKVKKEVKIFEEGLALYYEGKWKKAYPFFKKCKLTAAKEFCTRTEGGRAPKNWNGIWEMKTK